MFLFVSKTVEDSDLRKWKGNEYDGITKTVTTIRADENDKKLH